MEDNNSQGSFWNPFAPTARDIKRTEVLADKNPVIAGVLGLFLMPLAWIYLNRGVNNLKIFVYIMLASVTLSFFIGVTSKSESDVNPITEKTSTILGFAGSLAMTIENIRSVTLARKRLSSK
ncbi:MAG: hypothetical protein VKN72_01945 [Nostocales cyanobacterium 94392]|nr:hypothetical protein [Nostocales cyanobacterium 94392]